MATYTTAPDPNRRRRHSAVHRARDPKADYLPPEALPETNLKLQDTLGVSASVIISGGALGGFG